MRNLKNPTPLLNDASPRSGLQCNVLESLVRLLCMLQVTKQTRDGNALHWRPERGPALFCSEVGFLRLLISALIVYIFQLHPSFKRSFFANIFPIVPVV